MGEAARRKKIKAQMKRMHTVDGVTTDQALFDVQVTSVSDVFRSMLDPEVRKKLPHYDYCIAAMGELARQTQNHEEAPLCLCCETVFSVKSEQYPAALVTMSNSFHANEKGTPLLGNYICGECFDRDDAFERVVQQLLHFMPGLSPATPQ